MKPGVPFVAALAAIALLPAGLRAQPPRTPPIRRPEPPAAIRPANLPLDVRATTDRTAMWVGDRLTYTIDILCNPGVDILLDDLAKEKLRVNGLDIVASDSSATTDAAGRTRHLFRYVMTTYRVDTPSPSIEPISARYYQRQPGQRLQDMAPAGEVQIPGATVALRSTLPDAQATYDLRDARDPASRQPLLARAGSIGLALIVLALAPAAFLLVALARRHARRTVRRSARQMRLDHRATLDRLRALDVATEDDRRRAYDEISAAVRQHLADTAGVPAPSLTATEIDAALAATRTRVPRESVSALLATADDARYGPPQTLPSAQACRDALSTAEAVLGGR